ncbi:MAG: DNA primase [Candidatus Gribaldobacteria bacterium]|nr:DNA primase [Candidatus Gribaldobacteria bacterium]
MSDLVIQQIKDRLNIVEVVSGYLKLEKTGINLRARCPFHGEKSASFFVSPTRQSFKCFGCGVGGSVFDFVMKMEGIEFGDALRLLAHRAGVALPTHQPETQTKRARLYEICELSAKFFERQLSASAVGQKVQAYLLARGLKPETIKQWRLGYGPDQWQALGDFLVGQNYQRAEIVEAGLAVVSEKGKPPYDRFRGRIIFPIFDANGQIIGFGGRVFGEKPKDASGHETGGAKYINTPATLLYDKSRVLYGLHLAKTEIRRADQCVLTEGYTDVILAHQAGFVNTISTSGTAMTNQHLQIIKRYTNNLLMAFDADAGGDAATTRGIDLALAEEFNVKVIPMPQGLDPADVISQDATKWAQCLESAQDIIAFYFAIALHRFDKTSASGKKQIAQMVLPVLKKIANAIIRSHWLGQLSSLLNISEDILAQEMAKIKINPVPSNSQSADSAKSEIGEKPNKLRREILQERLVGLLLACPAGLDFVENAHFDFFTIPSARETITALRANPVDSPEAAWAVCQKLSQEKKEIAEFLAQTMFWAEESQSVEDFFAEIQLCLEQLKGLSARKNLQTLGAAIRQAETSSDETQLADLMRQFSQISKEII